MDPAVGRNTFFSSVGSASSNDRESLKAHITDIDFGLGALEDDSTIFTVINAVREDDPLTAKLLLQDAYQQSCGVFDHMAQSRLTGKDKRPLASVAMHPGEDLSLCSAYSMIIERYAHAKVWDYFHISVTDFLELPLSRIEEMLRVCRKLLSEDAKRVSSVMQVENL